MSAEAMEARHPEKGIPWESLEVAECQGNSQTIEEKGKLEKLQPGKM